MQRLEVSGAVRHIYIYIYMCVCVCVVRRLKVNHFTARSRLVRVLKLVNRLFI
jgi:hypothetical protein